MDLKVMRDDHNMVTSLSSSLDKVFRGGTFLRKRGTKHSHYRTPEVHYTQFTFMDYTIFRLLVTSCIILACMHHLHLVHRDGRLLLQMSQVACTLLVCLYVCVCVGHDREVCCAKTDEPIYVPFG